MYFIIVNFQHRKKRRFSFFLTENGCLRLLFGVYFHGRLTLFYNGSSLTPFALPRQLSRRVNVIIYEPADCIRTNSTKHRSIKLKINIALFEM